MIEPKAFLVWTGGKASIKKLIIGHFPFECNTYYEPFLGGGSIFFQLAFEQRFKKAVISDWNGELINMYLMVKNSVDKLVSRLYEMKDEFETNPRITYNKYRAMRIACISELDAAARTIFLNATAFNHIYVVNAEGQFNAAFGMAKFASMICKEELLYTCSEALNKNVTILHGDFERTTKEVNKNDFVYLDPPYYPLSATSSFDGYRSGGFELKEHWRVSEVFKSLAYREIGIIQSNTDCEFIREEYSEYKIVKIPVQRRVNCHRGEPRQYIFESLISGEKI